MFLWYCYFVVFFFFFFKQKTAYEIVSGDWSSDVSSSDLGPPASSGPVGTVASANRKFTRTGGPTAMRTVTAASVAAGEERVEGLPAAVMEALGELAGAAKEGLLALSVGVGLGVLHELMEAEVDEVVGPKGRHIVDRTAVRHGHEGGEVTLGGRRVPVKRPRARGADGVQEVELDTYAHFAARDRLSDVMFERMLAGVSTRR